MKVWANNKKNKIKKILLGNVPTPDQLETLLNKKIPAVIKKTRAILAPVKAINIYAMESPITPENIQNTV